MRWRQPEMPVREKSLSSQSALDLDRAGSAELEQIDIRRFGRIETTQPTDPPR